MEKVNDINDIAESINFLKDFIEAQKEVIGNVKCEFAQQVVDKLDNFLANLQTTEVEKFIKKDFALKMLKINKEDQDKIVIEDNQLSQAQQLISDTCDKIKEMLLEKNRKYGNSALVPKRIFSKANPIEQINVRMDDKLGRIESGQKDEDENPEWDLLGYLILKQVAKGMVGVRDKESKK